MTRPGRKPLPRQGEYPRVGRYRLYDRAGVNRLRCRLCGRVVKRDNQWRHFRTEAGLAGFDGWPERAIERVSFLLRARRSRKNRRHAQYQYATGGEPWRER